MKLDIMQAEVLSKLATTATAEVSLICAVLGGFLGNEVIKAISGEAEPSNNTVLFDVWEGKCRTVCIQRKRS